MQEDWITGQLLMNQNDTLFYSDLCVCGGWVGVKDEDQEAKTMTTSRMSLSNVFKIKVIETSMSMYAMHVYRHALFECHS